METKEKLLRQYLVKFAEDQQAEWLKALEFTIYILHLKHCTAR